MQQVSTEIVLEIVRGLEAANESWAKSPMRQNRHDQIWATGRASALRQVRVILEGLAADDPLAVETWTS